MKRVPHANHIVTTIVTIPTEDALRQTCVSAFQDGLDLHALQNALRIDMGQIVRVFVSANLIILLVAIRNMELVTVSLVGKEYTVMKNVQMALMALNVVIFVTAKMGHAQQILETAHVFLVILEQHATSHVHMELGAATAVTGANVTTERHAIKLRAHVIVHQVGKTPVVLQSAILVFTERTVKINATV